MAFLDGCVGDDEGDAVGAGTRVSGSMAAWLSPLGATYSPCSLLADSITTAVGAPREAVTVPAPSSSVEASAVGTGYHHASDVAAGSSRVGSNPAADGWSKANEDTADA